MFFYFAAFKQHIGVYPPVKGDKDLQEALLPYRGEKGNLKFPLDQPIPYELIGRVAAALAREHRVGLNPEPLRRVLVSADRPRRPQRPS